MPLASTNTSSSPTTCVKICCISSIEEAQIAIDLGTAAIGLVSAMPTGPGVVPEVLIQSIATSVSTAATQSVSTFLLTSHVTAESIIEQQRRCRTNTLQLCDHVTPENHAALRSALPGVRLVQVVHVQGPESIDQAIAYADHIDALLLDSGNPTLTHKALGGTGRTHDWSISAQIVAASPVPVFLAGGLNAENVGAAIRQVRPFGVDICSGVRTNGELDPVKAARFMRAVSDADSKADANRSQTPG